MTLSPGGETGCSRLPRAPLVAADHAGADVANPIFHPWARANPGRAVPS